MFGLFFTNNFLIYILIYSYSIQCLHISIMKKRNANHLMASEKFHYIVDASDGDHTPSQVREFGSSKTKKKTSLLPRS